MSVRYIVTVLALLWPAAAWAAVPQAFLVQNSGWMESFYAEDSGFKDIVKKFIRAVTGPNETMTLSAFNQAVPGNESPRVLFTGRPGRELDAALDQLGVARKASGALADTDFKEAVVQTVAGPLRSQNGIIWIFTNNKNSPGNDQDTAKRNREFYELFRERSPIERTLAFVVPMPVKGRYSANGLMIYGLAWGAGTETRLIELASGPARTVVTEQAARLKPLDRDSVRLITEQPSGMRRDREGTIEVTVDVNEKQPVKQFPAKVENRFYPYVIRHAKVSATFTPRGGAPRRLPITPAVLKDIEPGAEHTQAVTVDLPVPWAHMPSVWSLAALSSMGTSVWVRGDIDIVLEDQRLEISKAFQDRLAVIFPGDPLPEILRPSQSVKESRERLPVRIRVSYPVWPLIVVGGGGLLALGLLGLLLALVGRERRFAVVVDGNLRRISVGPFRSTPIRSTDGAVIGRLKRYLGRPSVAAVSPGHSISVQR